MSIISDYKEKWIEKQMRYSQHPKEFWEKIIDMAIAGRKKMQADQLSPMGRNWSQDKWIDYLFKIYEEAEAIEKESGMENALSLFEVCVAEEVDNPELYQKLLDWYGGKRWLKDKIRIAKINMNSGLPPGVIKPTITFSGFKIDKTPRKK